MPKLKYFSQNKSFGTDATSLISQNVFLHEKNMRFKIDRQQTLPVVREYIFRATKETFGRIWSERNVLVSYSSAALNIFAQSKIYMLAQLITRRPLSIGIFSATRFLQKKYGEEEDRTHDLLSGKAISEVHFTPWSGDKVEFWQRL